MKKVWQWLKAHVIEDFHPLSYGLMAIYLAAWIILNYTINLENGVIDSHFGTWTCFWLYLLMNCTVYLGACAILSLSNPKYRGIWSTNMLMRAFVGCALIAADRSFYLYDIVQQWITDYDVMVFVTKVANQYVSVIVTLIALFIFYKATGDSKRINYYGLAGKNLDVKPYWQLFLLMLPLIYLATFNSGFINYYPTFKRWEVLPKLDIAPIQTVLLYEGSYLLNFIQVEMLFRGFLVLGVGVAIGERAIIPMVAVYCALHFGKPVGETISSIFGGYILGVLAFKSRNIYGGIFLHMGIAAAMDLFAWLVKYGFRIPS